MLCRLSPQKVAIKIRLVASFVDISFRVCILLNDGLSNFTRQIFSHFLQMPAIGVAIDAAIFTLTFPKPMSGFHVNGVRPTRP